MIRYPIARNGIYRTIQGEGALLGTPMVFIRLGGCSIGCAQCDTDYKTVEHLTAAEIRERVTAIRGLHEWVAVTGGEPADHDLWELGDQMRLCGRTYLSTSGMKSIAGAGRLFDFISVSPHCTPDKLEIQRANQINLVPGLNGLSLKDWEQFNGSGFSNWYATPNSEDENSLAECVEFVRKKTPVWRLGVQAHKLWGLQ